MEKVLNSNIYSGNYIQLIYYVMKNQMNYDDYNKLTNEDKLEINKLLEAINNKPYVKSHQKMTIQY